MAASRTEVAIVGGGASGALVAAHLRRSASAPLHITLVERCARVGEGVAYGTTSKCHLLNVPARNMSAFEDDPSHFVRWLASKGVAGAGDRFVPRPLYARYLRELLKPEREAGSGRATLDVHHAAVVDMRPGRTSAQLTLADGCAIAADAVILATGIVMREFPASLVVEDNPRCVANPWARGALAKVAPGDVVTLLGSGLTAVDVLLGLRESGHSGPVHAISRHGLLPRAHRAEGPRTAELSASFRDLAGSRVRPLLHQARRALVAARAEGADWRDAVDVLRPLAPRLWAELSPEERLRFYRHLERLWSIHRHRMAPEVAQAVEELRESGAFFLHAGTVERVSEVDNRLSLRVKLSARVQPRSWTTDWLVNCTGTDPHVFGDDPLMTALKARGLASPGALGMGIATDDRGRALDANGRPLDWLWAIGSLRQGQLLESTAVPEIRTQARDVALDIERFLIGRTAGELVAPGPPARPPTAQLLAS